MRVAFLAFGFAESCIAQANGLAPDCDVLLLLPKCEAQSHEERLDPRVDYRPFKNPRLRQPVRQMATVASLSRQIRDFRPDVIHFQHGHLWFNFALPFLSSIPLVMSIHDPRHHTGDRASRLTPQLVMDFGYRRADQLIVHGEAMKRQVVELLDISPEKIHVILRIAIGNMEAVPKAEDDGKTILFFGRIWEYKGLEYLIQAEPMIAKAVPDARIVIAGEGEDFDRYRRMMNGSKRFVVHNRYVSTAERSQLFRQASLVALPYIDASQSGVVPVAYSFGKPVVATNTGALAESVVDGVTGRVVPPRDTAALAGAIIELLTDPKRREAMGAAGRHKLDVEWSPQVVARRLIDVYRCAIEDRARVRPVVANGECVTFEQTSV
jgi:starch synthase